MKKKQVLRNWKYQLWSDSWFNSIWWQLKKKSIQLQGQCGQVRRCPGQLIRYRTWGQWRTNYTCRCLGCHFALTLNPIWWYSSSDREEIQGGKESEYANHGLPFHSFIGTTFRDDSFPALQENGRVIAAPGRWSGTFFSFESNSKIKEKWRQIWMFF